MINKTTMGERIKKRRTLLNLTQADVAKELGVSREAVSQWERGDTKGLKPENLLKVVGVLKTNPEWLVFGSGSETAIPVLIEPSP